MIKCNFFPTASYYIFAATFTESDKSNNNFLLLLTKLIACVCCLNFSKSEYVKNIKRISSVSNGSLHSELDRFYRLRASAAEQLKFCLFSFILLLQT